MWLIAEYVSTTLFSLKPSWATSSGGKSLLLPTPYAIKMALLDALCRVEGVAVAQEMWPTIRACTVALRGPERIVVTNTFTKILKPRRGELAPGSADSGPYQKTIGFREYVFHGGPLGIGLSVEGRDLAQRIPGWLLNVNYLGKRGGFVQLMGAPQLVDSLPAGFVAVTASATNAFALNGFLQRLDDTGSQVTFEQVSIYSDQAVRLDKDRIFHQVILPYRLVRSSKSYSYYERIDLGTV